MVIHISIFTGRTVSPFIFPFFMFKNHFHLTLQYETKRQIVSVGEDAEKLGHLYIVGRNVKWWSNLESVPKLFKVLNTKLVHDPEILLLGL